MNGWHWAWSWNPNHIYMRGWGSVVMLVCLAIFIGYMFWKINRNVPPS